MSLTNGKGQLMIREKLYTAQISNILNKKRSKVMLFNLYDSFNILIRDHVWIKRSKQLNKFLWRKHTIRFCATEFLYGKANGKKTGIKHLKSIHIIKDK